MDRITEMNVAVAIFTTVTGNVLEKQLYLDAWTDESEVILALMGLRLKKYIDLRKNWAAENYTGPDRSRRLIASVGRVYYQP